MKNNIIYISLLSALVLFGSCKKQLDLKPSDVIIAEQALQTMDDLNSAVNGVYALNGTPANNGIYIGSILADETAVGSGNHGQGLISFKWQYSAQPGEYNQDFASYYSAIDAINRILQVIDAVPTKSDNDIAGKKRMKAEITALRGIYHYELLIRFMPAGYDANALGVPIMLTPDLMGQPARAKVGDVITQILADLAVGRNEPDIPNAPDYLTRLSQASIAAYQARVALLTKTWADVVTYAKQAIQLSGGATLASGQDFADYWGDVNTIESLWTFHGNAAPQLLWIDTDGSIYFVASNELLGEYDENNDVRFATYFQDNLINKYPGSSLGPQINDLKLVRTAELYLDLSEAYAQQNDLANAALYLNTLREARIDPYTDITFSSKQQAISLTLTERYKELCFEGFRFFDLKRNSLSISRDPSDVQSPEWLTLPANDYHFALPIPQHEVFANKNMVQNLNY